jgi:hypothetical protein
MEVVLMKSACYVMDLVFFGLVCICTGMLYFTEYCQSEQYTSNFVLQGCHDVAQTGCVLCPAYVNWFRM